MNDDRQMACVSSNLWNGYGTSSIATFSRATNVAAISKITALRKSVLIRGYPVIIFRSKNRPLR